MKKKKHWLVSIFQHHPQGVLGWSIHLQGGSINYPFGWCWLGRKKENDSTDRSVDLKAWVDDSFSGSRTVASPFPHVKASCRPPVSCEVRSLLWDFFHLGEGLLREVPNSASEQF